MGGIDTVSFPALREMQSISLQEMDGIKLMNRLDTKFVTTEEVLKDILESFCKKGYLVCTINGRKITDYTSLYYDTPELSMYMAHQDGKKTRVKVRTRKYQISGDTFLEIKRKNNHGRTRKKRIPIPENEFAGFASDPDAARFVEEKAAFSAGQLEPRCTTEFSRITLVDPAKSERLTIDTRLHFRNYATLREGNLGDAVIIELKQDARAVSPTRSILLEHRVKPYRISKYTIGTVLTDWEAKDNRFKEKIRYIEKTTGKTITDRYESSK